MDLLARRCRDRSNQLESYVDTWQIDHKEAMQVCDLEELIKECLELVPLLRRAWDRASELSFDAKVKSELLFVAEDLIRVAIDRTTITLRKISRLIETFERAEYTIVGAKELRDAVCDVEILDKEAESRCSPFDARQAEESLAAYASGDYKSAEGLLHELQGNGPSAN
jgi:hypothetical protein